MDFCGKVAIVTGATSGIGEETARQLMAEGAQVLAVGRSAEKGAELEKLGAKFYACDLSDPEQIEALCARIARDYPKVDILINNAGMSVDGTVETLAPAASPSMRTNRTVNSAEDAILTILFPMRIVDRRLS